MANRYWVGGTATWDATAGSKWALTSGGAGGQAVPTSSDTVFFDANSGANTITIGSSTAICSTLTMTGFTGTLAFGTNSINVAGNNATIFTGGTTYSVTGTPVINCTYSGASGTRTVLTASTTEANSVSFNITGGADSWSTSSSASAFKNLNFTGFSGTFSGTSGTRTIYGNLTISSGMNPYSGFTIAYSFASASSTQFITLNTNTLNAPVSIGVVGSTNTVRLVDNFTMSSSRTLTLTSGTFDANNQNVTVGLFSSNNSNTRTLTMGSGTWTLGGTGNVWNISSTTTSGLTFNVDTANIVLSDTSATARNFLGAGLSYNTITIGGTTGSSTTTFTGSNNVIASLSSTKTVAHTISFNSTSITINAWSVIGTAGNVVTVNSGIVGNQRTVTYGGSQINLDYMSFTDVSFSYGLGATVPYLVYAGANSTNGGNNSGIAFIDGTTQKAYRLTTGTSWTTPADWNNSSNTIHMIGAGGGGATSAASGNNRAAGGGGGGGGYTVLTNQTLTGAIPYTIGTSAGNGNGGNTTFNTTNTAGGGLAGTATTVPLSTGGSGGTGVTFNGGNGGAGSFGTAASTGYGAGSGGGAGGVNGVGGNGGSGFGSSTTANLASGGGGGNGGGSAGGNAASATFGTGGNNFGGTGGGATNGASGTFGGGGAGGVNATTGGNGGSGIDIANTIGGGGGKGGGSSSSNITANTGLYGGGGGGSGVTTAGGIGTGGAGSQGVIFIVYTPSGAPVANSNFFLMFG